MLKIVSRSPWVLLVVGLLLISAALVAESLPATTAAPAAESTAVPVAAPALANPAPRADALPELSADEVAALGQKCEVQEALGETAPVELGWTPPNLSCPYKICGGGCYTNADCCGAFGGDGYCDTTPEAPHYCVCPDW